jgi:hypothetical protein
MQGAERQPALRQMLVDRLDTERQHQLSTRDPSFETLNAFSKRV